jgi:ribonuclease Z
MFTECSLQLGRAGAPELVFLGTGSAIPSKYRNVSAIFLNVPGHGGLLMDAGEGSLSQLYRRYGGAEMWPHLAELWLVWILHSLTHHLMTNR